MMNLVTCVGRLVSEPNLEELESGKKVCRITLAVPRSYKNEEGIYETDFIDIVLWDAVATNTTDYCHKGDLIGVKGRMQTDTYETENGDKKKTMYVVAERVSFLASKKANED